MKTIGGVLVGAGVIWSAIAFNMETAVEAGGESYGSGEYSFTVPKSMVNNIGLMERRRNHLMFGGLTILCGVILFGFGSIKDASKSGEAKPEEVPASLEPVYSLSKEHERQLDETNLARPKYADGYINAVRFRIAEARKSTAQEERIRLIAEAAKLVEWFELDFPVKHAETINEFRAVLAKL